MPKGATKDSSSKVLSIFHHYIMSLGLHSYFRNIIGKTYAAHYKKWHLLVASKLYSSTLTGVVNSLYVYKYFIDIMKWMFQNAIGWKLLNIKRKISCFVRSKVKFKLVPNLHFYSTQLKLQMTEISWNQFSLAFSL